MNNHISGVKGEDLATAFLKKNKYKIIERNYRCQFGEVDIIATDGNYIVFVEVKRRLTDKYGAPCEAVTPYKQQTIIKCATLYLAQKHLTGKSTRFDVVEVFDKNCNIIKNAFAL